MTTELIIWCSVGFALGVIGSAVFSGIETGIYTLNRVRLHVFAHSNRTGAATMERLLRRPNLLLAALLVGNNVVNYLVTISVGSFLDGAGFHGWSQVVINTIVIMPVLLILGEIVPKDLFRAHADRWPYACAGFMVVWQKLLTVTGIVPALGWIIRLFERNGDESALHTMHPRRRVTALIREGVGHGLISPYQSDMVGRAMQMDRMQVRDVMIPWPRAVTIRVGQPSAAVWDLADRIPHERAPLLDASGKPVGVIQINRVLTHAPDQCPPLETLTEVIATLSPDESCRSALKQMQRDRTPMAVVLEKGRPIGLVTTKELVEPIVGELEVW